MLPTGFTGDPLRAPRLAYAAATVLALEAIALGVVVVVELMALSSATSLLTAIALTALTALGAVALALFAVGVARGVSITRSGAIVLHVLAVILAIAALTIDPPAQLFAAAVGIPGVVGFALLIASARKEGREGYLEESDAASDPSGD